MLRAECPECGEPVELRDNTQVGDHVICIECNTELEVLGLYPLDLDYALDDEWDDEWDEDEDYENPYENEEEEETWEDN
jgi:lysine biosynthesis protein LysW